MTPHDWKQLPHSLERSAFLVDYFTLRCRHCEVAVIVKRAMATSFYSFSELQKKYDAGVLSPDCDLELVKKVMDR